MLLISSFSSILLILCWDFVVLSLDAEMGFS